MRPAVDVSIREIDPASESEIELVARRMCLTLIEVVGEERGSTMYSFEWLVARVRWHLDTDRVAKVFVATDASGAIVAHAIAREERDDAGVAFGYFSTLYVDPTVRRSGVAVRLMDQVEHWFAGRGLRMWIYNTAAHHERLIGMFEKRGYRIALREGEMVQLRRGE
jgi:GNAT superfamily N-acetyltransferase